MHSFGMLPCMPSLRAAYATSLSYKESCRSSSTRYPGVRNLFSDVLLIIWPILCYRPLLRIMVRDNSSATRTFSPNNAFTVLQPGVGKVDLLPLLFQERCKLPPEPACLPEKKVNLRPRTMGVSTTVSYTMCNVCWSRSNGWN